jgi:hypothetical protein
MHNLELKFSVSDMTLALIDELRDSRTREDLLRQVMQLGLCELIESTARTHRDYMSHVIAGHTKDYRQARQKLFGVEEPQNNASPRLEAVRAVTQRDGNR